MKESKPQAAAEPKSEAANVKSEKPVQPKPQKRDGKNREVTEKAVADAQYFAENLIHLMGLEDAKIEAVNGGNAVDITVSGENGSAYRQEGRYP